MSDPYTLLAEYARKQQELVADNRLEELSEVAAQLEELVAALPEAPPEESRAALVTAQQALGSGIALLEARVAATRDELGRVAGERRTRARYSTRVSAPTIDAQG